MEGTPLSKAALAAIAAAGVALVLAVVSTVVVIGRSPPGAGAAPGDRALIEVEADAEAVRALLLRDAVTLAPGGLLPRDPVALGLSPGDILVTFGGRPLHAVTDLQVALRGAIRGGATALVFEIERGGKPLVVRIAARGELKPPAGQPGLVSMTSTDPDQQEILNGITKIDDEHVDVTRAAIEKVLANPLPVSKGARIVPSIKNGEPDGVKIYALRPSSIYSALGLQNGDTIHSINDQPLNTPDQALELYTELRTADVLVLELTRRGRDASLTITIR